MSGILITVGLRKFSDLTVGSDVSIFRSRQPKWAQPAIETYTRIQMQDGSPDMPSTAAPS